MKQYRLKKDTDYRGVIFIPKGTLSDSADNDFVFFKSEHGTKLGFYTGAADFDECVEELRGDDPKEKYVLLAVVVAGFFLLLSYSA